MSDRRIALAVLACLGVIAVLRPAALRAAREPVYALVGGRVVPVSGPPVEGGTVVIRDGLIEAVGSGIAVPPDARVVDMKGLTVTPGLIDGFGGTGLPAPVPRPAGTGAANAPPAPAGPGALAPQAMALDRIRPAEVAKARDQGITTALVIPREGVLPGRSALVNLAGDNPEAMALKQPAALHVHMTTLARQYPASLMGTVAYVRQALADAAHYRDEWTAYRQAPRGRKRPRYDSALEAWQDVLTGTLPLVVTAPRENDLRRALALTDEFKVVVIAAGAPQAFRLTDLVKARRLPLLVSVNYDPPRATASFADLDEEKERRDIEEAELNPAALHKAGVTFALVSGYAPDFLAGVRKAIEKGLPAEAALRAVTLTPAEILGVSDRLGSLEAGKIANVVAWSGEPFGKDTKPKMVFVDGRLYEPEERSEPRKEGEGRTRPSSGTSPSPSPGPSASPSVEFFP